MAERLVREPERYVPQPSPYAREEPPVVCQIGGHDATTAALAVQALVGAAAAAAASNSHYYYHEVNLNAECPSNHVCTKHEMGAALMKRVNVAVDMLRAMRQAALASSAAAKNNDNDDDDHENVPPHENHPKLPPLFISIKTRITVDDESDQVDDFLIPFIQRLYTEAGCRRFYLHARRVYTAGLLSCKKNRLVPPLNYPAVYRVCERFPDCDFWINGGIMTIAQAKAICWGIRSDSDATLDDAFSLLHKGLPCRTCQAPHGSCVAPPPFPAPSNLRGCMLGRAVMEQPAVLARVDTDFYGATTNPSRNRRQVLQDYCDYLQHWHPPTCQSTTTTRSLQSGDEENHSTSHQAKVFCPNCGYDGTGALSSSTSLVTPPQVPQPQPVKSAKHLGRMLKPTMGLFHGVKQGGRSWTRILQALGRDPHFIQCGPALVLRLAVERMPAELLDLEF